MLVHCNTQNDAQTDCGSICFLLKFEHFYQKRQRCNVYMFLLLRMQWKPICLTWKPVSLLHPTKKQFILENRPQISGHNIRLRTQKSASFFWCVRAPDNYLKCFFSVLVWVYAILADCDPTRKSRFFQTGTNRGSTRFKQPPSKFSTYQRSLRV